MFDDANFKILSAFVVAEDADTWMSAENTFG
jgi:hypothetical protein